MLEIWRKFIIIPILKLGKDNYNGMNWRPISLLCPADKTLAKLLLSKILTHITILPVQHGFRPKHSTCTALSMINTDISAGFSRIKPAHRTVLGTIDLMAAFDYVGPSQTARLCHQHQNTGNISSLAPQLYAEQT